MSQAANQRGSEPALQIRGQASKRRRRRRRIAVIAGLLVLVILCGVLVFSPVLEIRQISVQGQVYTQESQVTQIAQSAQGQPLLLVDTSQISDQVEAITTVSSVDIKRSLPHTLVIEVTDRTPVYQVQISGQYHWISDQGVDFYTSADAQQVPTAELSNLDNQQLLADIATVVSSLDAELLARVQTVTASSAENIQLHLDNDQTVIWGSADQTSEKAALLPVLLNQEGTSYDISAPGYPAVR